MFYPRVFCVNWFKWFAVMAMLMKLCPSSLLYVNYHQWAILFLIKSSPVLNEHYLFDWPSGYVLRVLVFFIGILEQVSVFLAKMYALIISMLVLQEYDMLFNL